MPQNGKMKLGEMLRGCRLGQIQSVGIMQMIPLLNLRTDEDRFARPSEAIISTTDYGKIHVQNPTGRVLIVPLNSAYMTKEKVQDHATTTAGVVRKGAAKGFTNSLCIEQAQPGLIPADKYRLSILPASIRADISSYSTRGTEYSGSWNFISNLTRETGVNSGGGNLRLFFERFEKELDEFIAQFEPVPGQVGAIILIAGEIIGIERAPTQACWVDTWEALIRDCYGSRAIQAQKRLGDREIPPTRARMEGEIRSINDLERALVDAEDRERESVNRLVEAISEEELRISAPNQRQVSSDGLDVKVVSNSRIVGQVVTEGTEVVYASTVAAGAGA